MKKIRALVPFLLVLIAACSPAARSLQPGKLELRPGESAVDTQGGVEITFVKVLQDSRCPQGAMCIRTGQVQVLLEIRQGAKSFQYTLALGDLSDGSVNSVTVAGYQITLLELTPFRQVSQTIDPSDYKIVLDIQAK